MGSVFFGTGRCATRGSERAGAVVVAPLGSVRRTGVLPVEAKVRFTMTLLFRLAALAAITTLVVANVSARPAVAQTSPAPAATASPEAAPALADYDVFAYILSDAQRKTLDRDPRCSDARIKTDAFAASDGKELQTGVDAMAALEKCAVLSRVGDWADFRDYVITAAAAVAYRVGVSAADDRLLHRAVDDASHVTGFEASNATVTVLNLNQQYSSTSPEASGHGMQSGPAQSSEKTVHETKEASAYSGTYGKIATAIARASNEHLVASATPVPAKVQQH